MTYDTNQLTRASAINMSIRRLLMEVATFWQIGEKRVCTGGHESDGYPWQWQVEQTYIQLSAKLSGREGSCFWRNHTNI